MLNRPQFHEDVLSEYANRTIEEARNPTMADLLEEFGSFRRVMDYYWRALLPAIQERAVENEVRMEVRIGMKPLA